MDKARLADLAADVFDAVVAYFVTQAVTLPERRFIADGSPSFDCDLFAVHISRVHAGEPGAEDISSRIDPVVMLSAAVSVYVVRCVPTVDDQGNAPSAEGVSDSAEAIQTDAAVLVSAILTSWETSAFGGCTQMAFVGLDILENSGGLGGCRADFEVGGL